MKPSPPVKIGDIIYPRYSEKDSPTDILPIVKQGQPYVVVHIRPSGEPCIINGKGWRWWIYVTTNDWNSCCSGEVGYDLTPPAPVLITSTPKPAVSLLDAIYLDMRKQDVHTCLCGIARKDCDYHRG